MHILVNSCLVDISHLAPINFRMDINVVGGKVKRNALLEFRFSNHCYSRGAKEGESIPDGMLVLDGQRERVFCNVRYGLSRQLSEHITLLVESNGYVHKSRHLNFFSISIVSVTGVEMPYYVFMRPKKLQVVNQPAKIDILIESAYHPDDPAVPPPSCKGTPRRLSDVLGDIWCNKKW